LSPSRRNHACNGDRDEEREEEWESAKRITTKVAHGNSYTARQWSLRPVAKSKAAAFSASIAFLDGQFE
jgi:hypothetical protein